MCFKTSMYTVSVISSSALLLHLIMLSVLVVGQPHDFDPSDLWFFSYTFIPLKSHDFAMSLTVSGQSHSQLRKSQGKRIHKLIHKLFWNFWTFEIQQPSPLFFEGLDTTIHIWKTNAK